MLIKKLLLIYFISFTIVNLYAQDQVGETVEDFEDIRHKIFPVIKVTSFVDTNTTDPIDSSTLIYKKIAGDLLCFYGVDDGKQFNLLSKNQLPEYIDIDRLDEIARQNLVRETRNNMQLHKFDFGGGLGIDCGNRHEAALVTLSSTFKMITERLGNNIVFAVPAEDLVIFVNGEHEWEIKDLTKSVEEIHKAGKRLLSKKLYVYRDGNVEEK